MTVKPLETTGEDLIRGLMKLDPPTWDEVYEAGFVTAWGEWLRAACKAQETAAEVLRTGEPPE